jgi:hypothetical protein
MNLARKAGIRSKTAHPGGAPQEIEETNDTSRYAGESRYPVRRVSLCPMTKISGQ